MSKHLANRMFFDFDYWTGNTRLSSPVGFEWVYAPFNANSPYQPLTAGGGTSAVLFDNMMALYTRGKVYRVTCDVELTNFHATPCYIELVCRPHTDIALDISNGNTHDWLALPTSQRSKRILLSGVNTAGYHKRIRKTFYLPAIESDYKTSVNYLFDASNNPTSVPQVQILAMSQVPTASAGAVDLWYNARFKFNSLLEAPATNELTTLD